VEHFSSRTAMLFGNGNYSTFREFGDSLGGSSSFFAFSCIFSEQNIIGLVFLVLLKNNNYQIIRNHCMQYCTILYPIICN